jgi:hypothetical protein
MAMSSVPLYVFCPGPQNSSVVTYRALLSKPVWGWSPKQVPPNVESNWYVVA